MGCQKLRVGALTGADVFEIGACFVGDFEVGELEFGGGLLGVGGLVANDGHFDFAAFGVGVPEFLPAGEVVQIAGEGVGGGAAGGAGGEPAALG